MDDWELKSFIRFLAQEWKEDHRQLMAHRMFAQLVEQAGFPGAADVLEKCRQSPALEAHLNEQFSFLEEMLPSPEEASSNAKILELLAKWKSTGWPN